MMVSGASIGPGGLKASTHRLGGGGSTSLNVRRAFVVKTAAGGSFVAYRTSRSRLAAFTAVALLGFGEPSYGASDQNDPRIAFFREYVREIIELHALREQASRELAESPSADQKLATMVRVPE